MRQAEAIRESIRYVLTGRIRRIDFSGTPEFPGDPDDGYRVTHALDMGFEQGYGADPQQLILGSAAPAGVSADFGAERSGAGWANPSSFVITSALVRLLGASEQFEMDVLKALFYYRPSGVLGHEYDHEEIFADPEVFLEVPKGTEQAPVYEKPPLWTWLRRHAENNVERQKVFSRVFGITTLPDGSKSEQAAFTKFRAELYEKRNAVAHGRKGVEMNLADYIAADVFIAQCMTHIHHQCREKLKLHI